MQRPPALHPPPASGAKLPRPRHRGTAKGSPSATDGWATLLNRVGTDRRAALSEQSTREDVIHQIESLRSQISGVSVDEEAAMMLRFQRAYEANAQFFRVVDGLLDVLMSSVR